MKKIILILALALASCGSEITQQDKLIITDINKVRISNDKGYVSGKYKYTFEGTELNYWSDSLYNIGDTLRIGK